MKTITLNTGNHIPAIGLGTWMATEEKIDQAITAAIEVGYRHIDCAPIYANEIAIGKTLNKLFQQNKLKRDELWITSKLWNSFHYPEDVMSACKKTLHDLGLDYLDLFLIHWPLAFDPKVGFSHPSSSQDVLGLDAIPIKATWDAMIDCVKAGLVKNIGVSNFSLSRIKGLLAKTDVIPVINQVECHPYLAQVELNEFCLEHNIHLTAYSPLGSRGRPVALHKQEEPSLLDHEMIIALADKYQKTPAQVILAWLLQRDIIVIPKSTNPQRIKENFAAQTVKLSPEDIRELSALGTSYRFVHPDLWEFEGGSFKADDIWK